MSTLYLHIGVPKTGSTYIQASLRMSRDSLARVGLLYPVGTEEVGLIPQSWSGGNASTLFDSEKTARRVMDSAMSNDSQGIVLSSEALLTKLSKDSTRRLLFKMVDRHRFSKVCILVFLRDPIQTGVSYWLQKVKRYGNTDDLDEFLNKTGFIQKRMALTAELLETLSSQPVCEIKAFNYSTRKSDMLTAVSYWLGIDRDILSIPEAGMVNRSLTPGEAMLQLELNRLLGPSANFLGKALTERITDLKPEKPSPSQGLQDSIWQEAKPWVDRINRFLPEDEGLVFDRMQSLDHSKGYRFTEEQIRVIAETLGGEVRKYWDSETKAMSIIRRIMASFMEKH